MFSFVAMYMQSNLPPPPDNLVVANCAIPNIHRSIASQPFPFKKSLKWCYKGRKMDDLPSDCPNNIVGVGAEDSRKLRRLANFDVATGEHDLDLRQAASSSLMP